METNWYKKRVDLHSPGSHTIAVMEWIRANNCPNLDHTIFYNDGRYEGIVSREEPDYIDDMDEYFRNASEYKGMKKQYNGIAYEYLIDGNYYFMTI